MTINRQCQFSIAALSLFFCFLAACSSQKTLTRDIAADLITKSDAFKAVPEFWLRTGTISNRDYTSPEYMVLQHHGWITGANVPCPPDVSPSPCWDVALTPSGVDTFRNFISKNAATSSYFNVPTAKRELITVTGISQEGYAADVDFQWRWAPLNELGSALYPPSVRYQATTGLRRYDDGWHLLVASARLQQRLEDALTNPEIAH
ncbi:MAG: hypothetical protein QOD84_1301 [Acidobacteriaceae bacterium]